jgi:hypothetical protein
MRKARAEAIPEFIGVDSEGIGRGKNHRTVLLGVGANSYVAKDLDRGLQWQEVFEFLYSQFRLHPNAAFVGFYLGYDFTNWISYKSGFPHYSAKLLGTPAGRALRKKPENRGQRSKYYPVHVDGWDVEMMGRKRLSIRPISDGCICGTKGEHCEAVHNDWMHVCDAGAFYQQTFLSVLDNSLKWEDEEGPVCSKEEYAKVLHGKNSLRTLTKWDDKLIEYNTLENIILARVMYRLAKGFHKLGIKLAKDQWYGPGAAAAFWLKSQGMVRRQDLRKKNGKAKPLMPKDFWDACRYSYYGGWFEIFSHGIIWGESYNYDINNAYPYAATKLPHLCGECAYKRGQGNYNGTSEHVLLYCTVFSKGRRMGAMPHREKDGTILRPGVTKGWYWRFELDSARRAGLVSKVNYHEWKEFTPCQHKRPMMDIHDLYALRKRVGKDSALGWAIKLVCNSIYGKFAQNVGAAPYNNWFYASYITAHCRAQILDSIATHPGKADSVLMVATDGICFDIPHPTLPISKELGEWGASTYTELVLFKPGVYWHKEGKERLLKVKSRGVPRDAFKAAVDEVENWFYRYQINGQCPGTKVISSDTYNRHDGWEETEADIGLERVWPWFKVPITFRLKSMSQALNEGKWETSAQMQEAVEVVQNSEPSSKRTAPHFNRAKQRIDTYYRSPKLTAMHTTYHKEAIIPPTVSAGIGLEGDAVDPLLEGAALLRDKQANYDLPFTIGYDPNDYEWTTVWGA